MNPTPGRPTGDGPSDRRGINLVALARPYFGLIMLTTGLLSALGVWYLFRMPMNIYPEVAFPRVVVIAQSPGLAVKDVEVAVIVQIPPRDHLDPSAGRDVSVAAGIGERTLAEIVVRSLNPF